MTVLSAPLRYRISSWNQITQCMSNNSRELRITVSDIIQNTQLNGKVIKVEHTLFGVLFACLVEGSGDILTVDDASQVIHEMSTKEILKELEKFGFLISYSPREHLSEDQIEYLKVLKGLGFDKIRSLDIHMYQKDGEVKDESRIVVFNISEVSSRWLDNNYCASQSELDIAMRKGSAINISAISRDMNFNWGWLDSVCSIDDILADNVKDTENVETKKG